LPDPQLAVTGAVGLLFLEQARSGNVAMTTKTKSSMKLTRRNAALLDMGASKLK
jgi:hypothetical protein